MFPSVSLSPGLFHTPRAQQNRAAARDYILGENDVGREAVQQLEADIGKRIQPDFSTASKGAWCAFIARAES